MFVRGRGICALGFCSKAAFVIEVFLRVHRALCDAMQCKWPKFLNAIHSHVTGVITYYNGVIEEKMGRYINGWVMNVGDFSFGMSVISGVRVWILSVELVVMFPGPWIRGRDHFRSIPPKYCPIFCSLVWKSRRTTWPHPRGNSGFGHSDKSLATVSCPDRCVRGWWHVSSHFSMSVLLHCGMFIMGFAFIFYHYISRYMYRQFSPPINNFYILIDRFPSSCSQFLS